MSNNYAVCQFQVGDRVHWKTKTTSNRPSRAMKVIGIRQMLGNLQHPEYYWQNYWEVVVEVSDQLIVSAPDWNFTSAAPRKSAAH